MYTHRELREAFHFCFLERLLKVADASLFVLKGGVNLRFFFRSPRYSEDMDIDVVAGSVSTLKKNGYKVLEDAALRRTCGRTALSMSRSTTRIKPSTPRQLNVSACSL